VGIACGTGFHRHMQTCAKCGVSDLTVATTTTRDGRHWPPLCSDCASIVRQKSARISAVARVEAGL
jgi:hypothetical protein